MWYKKNKNITAALLMTNHDVSDLQELPAAVCYVYKQHNLLPNRHRRSLNMSKASNWTDTSSCFKSYWNKHIKNNIIIVNKLFNKMDFQWEWTRDIDKLFLLCTRSTTLDPPSYIRHPPSTTPGLRILSLSKVGLATSLDKPPLWTAC